MARLNWTVVRSNVREAREQLEGIEALLSEGTRPSLGELQVMLEHAYHHLNIAWNARFVGSREYRQLTNQQFKDWGSFPQDLDLPGLDGE